LKTISHFRILAKLGSGGMGEVYLAEDINLDRKVAIKFVSPELVADERAKKSLIREARAAAMLDHPNICTIYEVGEDRKRNFIVMQYAEGETLAARIKNGPLDLGETLAVALQVGDALAEAHAHGIAHFDIKPQNIMLAAHGQVKVLDFGLARIVRKEQIPDSEAETARFSTRSDAIVGTVSYMSPEQLRGEELDGRSDIFSFGVTLYELVSGHQPFAAKSAAEIISAILTREPPPLRYYLPDLPDKFERIVRQCLEKNPERRARSVRELLIDLQTLKRDMDQSVIAADIAASHRRRLVGRRGKPIHSIAVLPLINAGADPNTEYLSDGITENIINSLSRLPELRVMARSTVFHYKGRIVDPQTVGKELGVRAVLSGKVLQIDDRLIISTELADVVDGAQLWGEQYNRKLSDILEVQEDISKEIVQKLRLHLTNEQKKRLTKQHTVNIVAYHQYLKGRYHWNKRTAEGFKKAIECFQQAIVTDPAYAPAHVGIADCYALLPFYDEGAPIQFYHQAKTAATRALEIDNTLAEAHTSLGQIRLYYDWDWAAAERELKRALELAPNSPNTHHVYSVYLSAVGRLTHALQEVGRALELDPVSLPINADLGVMFYFARQYDQAIQQQLKTIELDANFAPAHAFLAWAYAEHGMYKEAIAECEKASSLVDAPWILASLGYTHALAGSTDAAAQVLDQLKERASRGYVSPYDLALVYASLGSDEQALALLEAAFKERSGVLIWGLQNDPRLDGLRAKAAFASLLRRVGFVSSGTSQ